MLVVCLYFIGLIMKIIATPIPKGSHGVRVWINLPPGLKDTGEDYDFACNLVHVDKKTCKIAQAKGKLNNEVAIEIGLKAIALGYKVLKFHRSMGGLATRWATLVRSEDGMDYYIVDLVQ